MSVVTFGEMLLRLSPPDAERLLQSPRLRAGFGGSEANVAVSLACFGVHSEYVTRVPANAIGQAAVRALQAQGVSTGHIAQGGSRLGVYFVEAGADLRPMRVVYDRADSAFSTADARVFDWDGILKNANWLHLSGITPALSDAAAAIATAAVAAARAANLRISLDLNYRAALWQGRDPRSLIRPLATGIDLLIGNPVAVQAMLGVPAKDGIAPARLLEHLAATFGCRAVALTHREQFSASEHGWSSTLLDAGTQTLYRSCDYRVRLVDRVGGGDAFTAGLIYSHLTGRDPQSALDFATAAGALKLTIAGDWNLTSADEVEQVLRERGRNS